MNQAEAGIAAAGTAVSMGKPRATWRGLALNSTARQFMDVYEREFRREFRYVIAAGGDKLTKKDIRAAGNRNYQNMLREILRHPTWEVTWQN